MKGLIFAAFASLCLSGCQQSEPAQAPTAKTASELFDHAPSGRFVLSADPTAKLAFDTKTGLLCKTWIWSDDQSDVNGKFDVKAPNGKTYDFDTKEQANKFRRLAGISSADAVPLCVNLFMNESKTVERVVSSEDELPATARAQLKEGYNTTFANGQVWTLKNGQPEQVSAASSPSSKVGDVITRNGHKFKVTAVDKDGRVTSASPLGDVAILPSSDMILMRLPDGKVGAIHWTQKDRFIKDHPGAVEVSAYDWSKYPVVGDGKK